MGRPVETADEVRERIWRERQDGRTYQAIADGLNDDGITTVTGKAWSRALVGKQIRSIELDREAEEAAA